MKAMKTLAFCAALMTAAVSVPVSPVTVFAADEAPTSGTCGENCTWAFDAETGTLTISGTGEMNIYLPAGFYYAPGPGGIAPWEDDHEGGMGNGERAEAIKRIVVGEGITMITGIGCLPNLEEVSLPSTLKKIGDLEHTKNLHTFDRCDKLKSIVIPDGVESIDGFWGCAELTDVTIPASVKLFGGDSFQGSPWFAAKWTENPLVSINGILLDGSSCEGNVTIPDGITALNDGCFSSDKKLTGITIPDSVTSIGADAFYGCTALDTISIPESVVHFGSYAFGYPDEDRATPWLMQQRKDNKYVIVNHCLIDAQNGDLDIPDGVTEICMPIDQNMYCLNLTIPGTVKEIPKNLCSGGTPLQTLTLKEGVERINDNAFFYNLCLKELTLPDSLKYIGAGAFTYSGLESVTIPANVESIGEAAFFCPAGEGGSDNPGLKEITILSPDCKIFDAAATISNNGQYQQENGAYIYSFTGIIRGYDGSTAEAYAKKYDYKFESLGAAPEKPITPPALEPTLRGDLDLSNVVDVADAVILARYLVGDDSFAVSDQGLANADADGSGKLTTEDVTYIIKMIVGLI